MRRALHIAGFSTPTPIAVLRGLCAFAIMAPKAALRLRVWKSSVPADSRSRRRPTQGKKDRVYRADLDSVLRHLRDIGIRFQSQAERDFTPVFSGKHDNRARRRYKDYDALQSATK